jgi:hypothetical protein
LTNGLIRSKLKYEIIYEGSGFMDVDYILGNDAARIELWRRIIADDVGVTRLTHTTLKSMLHYGDGVPEMAERLNIPKELASTRRSANGRQILARLAETRPKLFENLFTEEAHAAND